MSLLISRYQSTGSPGSPGCQLLPLARHLPPPCSFQPRAPSPHQEQRHGHRDHVPISGTVPSWLCRRSVNDGSDPGDKSEFSRLKPAGVWTMGVHCPVLVPPLGFERPAATAEMSPGATVPRDGCHHPTAVPTPHQGSAALKLHYFNEILPSTLIHTAQNSLMNN